MDGITAKPTALTPQTDLIPSDLKTINAWVVWRYEWVKAKWAKVPYRTDGMIKASSTDSLTWGTFRGAVDRYTRGKFDGIGFVLNPQNRIIGVDIDHCVSESVAVWAMKIMFQLESYAELSPSAKGLRIFLKGSLPANGRKKDNIEMYEGGRYMTITGHHRAGTPHTIEERQAQIEALHKRVFAKPEFIKPRSNMPNVNLGDRELLEKAFRARNGPEIKALYGGNIGSRNRSSADMALCSHLAWYTKDADQIDRLFRESGLMRPKWDERHFADGRTYGEGTISKVMGGTDERSGRNESDKPGTRTVHYA